MTDPPTTPGSGDASDELPGRIDRSPDQGRIRRHRAKLNGRRRDIYDYVVVPAEIPDRFNEPLAELITKLSTDDPLAAATVLEEAQAALDEAHGRIDSAERRATTLQGTVAIASSLVVAGAALLLDPTRIESSGWRTALVLLLAGFVVSLIGCAWRALSVTGRMFELEQPGTERIHLRAKTAGTRAQTFRAAELLRAAGVASEIGSVKVGLLRSASWWLRLALGALAAFMVALAIYVATTNVGSQPTPLNQHAVPRGSLMPAMPGRGIYRRGPSW